MSDSNKQDNPGFTVLEKRHWAQDDEASGDDGSGESKTATRSEATGGGGESEATTGSEAASSGGESETREFQAETRQLLDLMIHSLYSNREIFLRELISNASDALDRYRFEALTSDALTERDDLQIRLEGDTAAHTLTVHDNGIGMSRQEVVDNIGTIAHSGTKELLGRVERDEANGEQALSLIGQFGVGFYSAFMVAEHVELLTRRAGESRATRWRSSGDGTYTIEGAERAEHGTTVTLQMRPADPDDGMPDFTSEWAITSVVKRYSDFVRYPIALRAAAPTDGAVTSEQANGGEAWRVLNSMKAIWTRREEDVTDEEYIDFYKHVTHEWEAPAERIVLHAEGRIEYHALLFVPAKAPFDLFYQHNEGGLQLYVNSVKIMERCEQLLPRYLRFIKGVVDSPDLPLNVSRELLQHNRQIAQIRRAVVKKVLATLEDRLLRKDRPAYVEFWGQFGGALKEGVISDPENKDRMVPLLLFPSSAGDGGELTTLAEYVARMKPEQDEIYYLTGDTRAIVQGSPHLERARAAGYEVLYLVDPIDELMVQYLPDVDSRPLRSLLKGEVELGSGEEREAAEKRRKEQQAGLTELLGALQEKLASHVKEVRLSSRLTNSAVCLVGEEQDESPRLRKLLRQSRQLVEGEADKRIMELNADHAIVDVLRRRFEANRDDPRLDDYAVLLLGQGLLAEGSELPDPAHFSRLVAELMVAREESK